MRMYLLGAAALIAFSLPNAAAAQEETIHDACKSDVAANCKDMKSGVALCMAQHRDKLSIACKAAIGDETLERQAKKAGKK